MKKVLQLWILKLNYNFSFEKLTPFFFFCDFMYGEIDLEIYTIAIIRLNTAFEKLKDSKIDDANAMFEESSNDLQKLYEDIVDDLNQDEVNLNEYYMFFQNGKQVFPQYIDALGQISQDELQDNVNSLLNVFNNLNKIADGFKGSNFNEF